jgi:hypothetical protein
MNPVVQKIIDQVGIKPYSEPPMRAVTGYSMTFEQMEKFVQLIVDECANICYDNEYSTPNKCAWRIEAHFDKEP